MQNLLLYSRKTIRQYLFLINNAKFSVHLCSIFIVPTKTCFSIEQKKIGSPLLDERRHFENRFLAGNDHVIDIVTSKDMKNISPCICRYLPVYYMIEINTCSQYFEVKVQRFQSTHKCW